MDLGHHLTQLRSPTGEIRAGGHRLGRHAPGVLGAGEELLSEGQMALLLAVRPLAAHPAQRRRHVLATGGGEGGLQDDVGVGARRQRAEHLDDHRAEVSDPADDRRVGLLAPQHPGCRDVTGAGGIPAGDRVPREGRLDGVAHARGLGLRAALDEAPQRGDIDRVVRAVVDVSGAEDAVLHGADEGAFGADERRTAIGERHLVDRRRGRRVVAQDEGLDADLACGVVEAEAAQSGQPRGLPLGGIPALPADPPGDEVDLAGGEGGVEDFSHQALSELSIASQK